MTIQKVSFQQPLTLVGLKDGAAMTLGTVQLVEGVNRAEFVNALLNELDQSEEIIFAECLIKTRNFDAFRVL